MPFDYPSYDPKKETAVYSRTPLGILNIVLGIIRERFSEAISGQENQFNWKPIPASDREYKQSELYIEKSMNVNSEVSNFAPAVVVKRAAFQFNSLVFEDRIEFTKEVGQRFNMGQMHSGALITCYSRSEGECEILANLIYELFVRGRWIIQKVFELLICNPRVLTEVTALGETQMEGERLYSASIQLEIVADYNHSNFPIAPKLKEIKQTFQALATNGEGAIQEILSY